MFLTRTEKNTKDSAVFETKQPAETREGVEQPRADSNRTGGIR